MGGRNPSQECGKIEVLKKPRGRKYDKIVNFLVSTVSEYAKFNSEFYRTMGLGDLAFGWGESQNQSIVWHSMRNSRHRALPFSERSYELKGESKRLDYWVLLKDIRAVLWIEYKHATGYVNRKMRFDAHNMAINGLNGISEDWEDDLRRLRAMTREQCEDLCFGSPQEGWDVVRMNLLVSPICRRIKKSAGEGLSRDERQTIGPEVFFDLSKPILTAWRGKTEPEFVAAWSLHEELQRLPPWSRSSDKATVWWDTYYGVYFFAWLELLTK